MRYLLAVSVVVVAVHHHHHHHHHRLTPRQYAGRCLARIIDREDPSWNPRQWNTSGSGAYGLPQALPGYKMATAGRDWRTNPFTQIKWMRRYARGRYGSECAALQHSLSYGWY